MNHEIMAIVPWSISGFRAAGLASVTAIRSLERREMTAKRTTSSIATVITPPKTPRPTSLGHPSLFASPKYHASGAAISQ